MEEKIIIDGVDVSECRYYVTYTKDCISDNKSYNKCESCNDCYYKQLKRLEQENEKIKKQYNCYACGNCKGTEDYINLEKHHKGLRKQFDEIQALFNDEYFKGLDKQTVIELAKKSIRVTTYNRELEHALEEIRAIVSGNYETLDPQAKQDIQNIITEIGE